MTVYIPGDPENCKATRRKTAPIPDEVAVLRAARGERLPLTAVERDAAIDRLDGRGCSGSQIARTLGITLRTVERRREARRREQHEDNLVATALELADDMRSDVAQAHRTLRAMSRLEVEQLACVLAAMVDPAVPLEVMAWWRLRTAQDGAA